MNMQNDNAIINDTDSLITQACITEISDLACVIQELKKYIYRVLKFMR